MAVFAFEIAAEDNSQARRPPGSGSSPVEWGKGLEKFLRVMPSNAILEKTGDK